MTEAISVSGKNRVHDDIVATGVLPPVISPRAGFLAWSSLHLSSFTLSW